MTRVRDYILALMGVFFLSPLMALICLVLRLKGAEVGIARRDDIYQFNAEANTAVSQMLSKYHLQQLPGLYSVLLGEAKLQIRHLLSFEDTWIVRLEDGE